MANVARVTRVSNTRGKRKKKRNVAGARRKLTAKQIKAGFGGKRRQAALKASRPKHKHKAKANKAKVRVKRRNTKRNAAPKRKATVKRAAKRPVVKAKKRKKAKKRNPVPALVMTLGPVNPKKRKVVKVAKKKTRKANSHRPKVRVKARGKRPTKRNPSVFGHSGGKDLATIGAGIVVGVSAAKLVPPMFDSILGDMATSLPAKVIITGVTAFAVGALAKKFVPGVLGDAIIAGGLAQTVSMALNGLLPATFPGRSYVTLSGGRGVGAFVPSPGQLTLPWNPVGSPSDLSAATVAAMASQDAGMAFAR